MDVQPGAAFTHGKQRPLFPLDEYYNFDYHPMYTVAKDDQHFYMIRSRHFGELFDLIVVENWTHGQR